MSKINKKTNNKQNKYTIYIAAVLVMVVMVLGYKFIIPQSGSIDQADAAVKGTVENGGLKIDKKDITEQAKFFSYNADGTYMEVLAVKASDGTIRTALNTCQVCYDSGRGYYKQEGDTVVCQNCGNVFGIDDIEVVKGGCNPVPIFEDSKTVDGESITIAAEFLNSNKEYFTRWKR
ncbi:MAG: DUF2318 domain-containing protein [Bacillota bacterium]